MIKYNSTFILPTSCRCSCIIPSSPHERKELHATFIKKGISVSGFKTQNLKPEEEQIMQ